MVNIIPAKYFRMNLNKKPLTKENLLKEVEDVEIYKFYTGQEVGKGNILSPLRDEKRPSFGYFVGRTGEICFNDFVLGKGDCIRFVELYFDVNFLEAMSQIVIDFGLQDKFDYKKSMEVSGLKNKVKKTNREDVIKKLAEGRRIDIKRRKAKLTDISFWMSFGISVHTLRKYDVHPIEYYFINGHIIATDAYAYAFIENKDGKETYKIYQPFNESFKWINNHNESVWQGWEQLPEKGETLIITKSLKDVMSITEVLGIPSVALQSESVMPKKEVVDELKKRFDDVYILYDNDYDSEENWGEKYSKKIALEHNLYFSQIPERFKSKDFSDLVKNHGEKTAKETWDDILCIPY